ncbi:MAG: aldehyde dehydrogenase family protein [Rhodospirillaceae bacterium]|nr:MAG: aldehyde dehydrogenase family protein [Rhodospirillaceae bacterium]
MTREQPQSVDFLADFRMMIGGRAVSAQSTFPVLNPATEQSIGDAPDCSEEQLNGAVAAARKALPAWKDVPLGERATLLTAIAKRLDEQVDPLALLLTREQGKPLADAKAEIGLAANWFRGAATLDLPPERRTEPSGRVVEIQRVPVGVVGALVPWNFPILLGAWKIAPALLAGNCLVVKPSPYTPLATLKLGELLIDILPPGVLNIISGGDRLGPLLTEHPGIDKISFTGSTVTGRAVMRSASQTLKRVTLELGGNDPAIVLPDVDVEKVATKLFWGVFSNSGQVCIAAKRIYVHDAIYDRFAAKMTALAKANVPGNGEAADVRLGPVQNKAQFNRVQDLIDDARARGYKFLTEPGAGKAVGYFIAPTIIDNPPDDARVVVEEPFGPLVPLLRYASVDEAVRRANASEFALAGSIWSADLELAAQIANRLDAGTVWINTVQAISPTIPFAGHKQSGIGVENGVEGLHEYTRIKAIVR